MKNRILVNAYFTMNLGDDLFLKILFDRYPNVKWDLLTANKSYKNVYSKYKNVKIIKSLELNLGIRKINLFNKLNEKILYFKKYDAFINIGGSIFIEHPSWEKELAVRKKLPGTFKLMDKRTFIIGANFGPYKDKLFKEKYKDFFSVFDDICFRDCYSYENFHELDNVRQAPDVVFNLKKKDILKEKSVGISIIDMAQREGLSIHSDKYDDKLLEIIKQYVELDYKIKLFSFCEKEGDMNAINRIVGNLEPNYANNITIINYVGNIEYFLDEFSSCELIIGTRFHSVILALIFNQGMYPLIYSEKTYNVLKDINMESNCCYIKDIQNLNVSTLVNNIKKNSLQNNNLILEAEKQFHKLDLFLTNSN